MMEMVMTTGGDNWSYKLDM